MSKTVTASLVVDFSATSADSSSKLLAEFDDRADGLNSGNTTFYIGDSPGFFVISSLDVTVTGIRVSEGGISYVGEINITKEESLSFVDTKQESLSYPVASGGVVSILNKSPGAPGLNLIGQSVVNTNNDLKVLAAYKISYPVTCKAYKLVGASGLVPALILVSGTAP